MPLLTVRAVEAHRPRTQPYKITLDRRLQLRIAPDGTRTLLVRYTVKGSNTERQYRLPQDYGEGRARSSWPLPVPKPHASDRWPARAWAGPRKRMPVYAPRRPPGLRCSGATG